MSFRLPRKHPQCLLDFDVLGRTLYLANDSRQPGTSTMSVVLLSCVFLLLISESKSSSIGTRFRAHRLSLSCSSCPSKIFMSTFDLAQRMSENLEDDQEIITPYQFGQLMVDWTNPQKAAEMYGG